MRYIYILFILGISDSVSSQTYHCVTLGQRVIPKEQTCLVIRQQAEVLQKIRDHIATYKELTALLNSEADAFDYCKQFQTNEEKPMSIEAW
jgi:hypothetical protein